QAREVDVIDEQAAAAQQRRILVAGDARARVACAHRRNAPSMERRSTPILGRTGPAGECCRGARIIPDDASGAAALRLPAAVRRRDVLRGLYGPSGPAPRRAPPGSGLAVHARARPPYLRGRLLVSDEAVGPGAGTTAEAPAALREAPPGAGAAAGGPRGGVAARSPPAAGVPRWSGAPPRPAPRSRAGV